MTSLKRPYNPFARTLGWGGGDWESSGNDKKCLKTLAGTLYGSQRTTGVRMASLNHSLALCMEDRGRPECNG